MKINNTKIEVLHSSLLDLDVDIYVNAANCSMRGGGGIDGLIHKQAGYGMINELIDLTPFPVEPSVPITTNGYNLKAKYVIHIAGPVYGYNNGKDPEILFDCYYNALQEADTLEDVKSIGFCSISTGVYGYPVNDASEVCYYAIKKYIEDFKNTNIKDIYIALYTQKEFDAFNYTFNGVISR